MLVVIGFLLFLIFYSLNPALATILVAVGFFAEGLMRHINRDYS